MSDEFDQIVKPVEDELVLTEVARQASLSGTYFLALRAMKVPLRPATDLTAEWMGLCGLDEDD